MFSKLQLLNFVGIYIDCCAFTGYVLSCLLSFKNKIFLLKPIGYLLLLTLIGNQLASYSGLYFKSGVIGYHIFQPLQFACLCRFFYINFENEIVKRYIPIVLILAIMFTIVNTAFFQKWTVFPTNFNLLQTLILIVWALILFLEKLDAPASVNIFKDPVFIVAIAILCFNIFSFIFFLLTNYFTEHKIDRFSSIYNVLYFANFIYYGLLVAAFIYSYKIVKNSAKN